MDFNFWITVFIKNRLSYSIPKLTSSTHSAICFASHIYTSNQNILYLSSSTKLYSFYRALSRKRAEFIIFYRGDMMISYEPFYKTLKEKGFSTYKLINDYGISRSLLDRLRHNRPISTVTLNDLCNILHCKVEDILLFIEDKK